MVAIACEIFAAVSEEVNHFSLFHEDKGYWPIHINGGQFFLT